MRLFYKISIIFFLLISSLNADDCNLSKRVVQGIEAPFHGSCAELVLLPTRDENTSAKPIQGSDTGWIEATPTLDFSPFLFYTECTDIATAPKQGLGTCPYVRATAALSENVIFVDENASEYDYIDNILVYSGLSSINELVLWGDETEMALFSWALTGDISVAQGANFDFEDTSVYYFQAYVSNSAGRSRTYNIQIDVNNIAELPPKLATPPEVDLGDRLPIGTHVVTVVGAGHSQDEDIVDTFRIESGNTNNDFSIDNQGKITIANELNSSMISEYNLYIIGTNIVGDSPAVRARIFVHVNSKPTADDFNISLDIGNSDVTVDWHDLSNADDADGDSLSATIDTQASNGICSIVNDDLIYTKSNDTNQTDFCILSIKDHSDETLITVHIYKLFWKAIASGSSHTLAIKSDGTLWAWGENVRGQLGDETFEDRAEPVQEATLSSNWRSISAGGSHSLGVQDDGTLWSWGQNNYGQVGNNDKESATIPTEVSIDDNNWTVASTGGFHVIAIKSDGTLWAWGKDDYGQLGDSNSSRSESLIPIEINTFTNWTEVSAGLDHSAAITSDNDLFTWGHNSSGQLGDATNTDRNYPFLTSNTTESWAKVYATENHTIALTTDNKIFGFGDNSYGQLGNGSIINKNTPTQEANTTINWVSIATSETHTLAVSTDGELFSWGENSEGALGDGTLLNRLVPTQELSKSTQWSGKLSAGSQFSIATNTIGKCYVWGYNNLGQLGFESDPTIPNQENTRATDWKFAAAGELHTLAIKSDDTLWAWGSNEYGQLGDGGAIDVAIPTMISDANWSMVDAGFAHSVAIDNSHKLYTWGQNDKGQLGNGTTVDMNTLTQIGTNTNWTNVSAGYRHTIAINANGELYSWGNNSHGELGDNTQTDRHQPTREYLNSTLWTKASAGHVHSSAIRSDGTLWLWGDNEFGQIGDGSNDQTNIATQEYEQYTEWEDVSIGGADLQGSYSHSIGLLHDDSYATLYAWGSNTYGQLGDGTNSEKVLPSPVTASSDVWKSISVGGYHTVALHEDGSIWSWGRNYFGQLGDGTKYDSKTPTQEATESNDWVFVTAGYHYTVAIKSDGTLWSWGDNYKGQLANKIIIPKEQNE